MFPRCAFAIFSVPKKKKKKHSYKVLFIRGNFDGPSSRVIKGFHHTLITQFVHHRSPSSPCILYRRWSPFIPVSMPQVIFCCCWPRPFRPLWDIPVILEGDVAQLVERQTATTLTQVQFPCVARDFSLTQLLVQTLVQCWYTPVCIHICMHLSPVGCVSLMDYGHLSR